MVARFAAVVRGIRLAAVPTQDRGARKIAASVQS
jgi:hypothetical protein